ncbi:MAG TPA: T9SS type A sorting domain-containing protein [Saprospiraceae bacterium]|nr:T9SS type A sorting domain-containing protein [Saprospiraceae bacterium]
MKKRFSLILAAIVFLFSYTEDVSSQVSKNIIVEHFTNSRCPICANRNPGFYQNLRQQQNISCISIHPSAPYNTCPLNQANRAANDARTHFYGIYGGTPRLVINGEVVSAAANYANPALFDPYDGQSPLKISITQYTSGNNDVTSRITIEKVSQNTPESPVLLFAGLVEDTVRINGGNGEPEHYNVLRRSLYAPEGMEINLPASVGDSIVFEKTESAAASWNFERMKTVAIVQRKDNKALIQSFISSRDKTNTSTTSINKYERKGTIQVYPNPARDYIVIDGLSLDSYQYDILSINGQRIQTGILDEERILLEGLKEGLYILKIYNQNRSYTSKFWKGI